MNNNIPAGYDENGVRNGLGKWEDMKDGEVKEEKKAKAVRYKSKLMEYQEKKLEEFLRREK